MELSRREFVAGSTLLAAGGHATSRARASPGGTSLASTVEQRVEEHLDEYDIPGATVAVVDQGDVTLTAGYGVADETTGRPVEATTSFRIGSLSKPVVWTAIGRLIANGDLDADTPVSTYLDDDLCSWSDPVTLAHLATHTGGFATTNEGLWYGSPSAVDPLPTVLERSMPSQIHPPGTRGVYSNHGVGLAGQVLAAVAGEPFPDAMDRLLFEPAGMTRSSFHQPLPADIRAEHAAGHHAREAERPYEGVGVAPAGAMSASARDMATFMQLHVQGGVLDGAQVLDPATVDSIQRQWFTHDEALSGMTLGFVERRKGDVRALTHNGATPQFQSTMLMIPDQDVGVFVSFNSDRGEEPRDEMQKELLADLLPATETPDPVDEPTPGAALDGTYQVLGTPETTRDALIQEVFATTIDVSADTGALTLDALDGRWVEIEPLVFEHVETGRRLAFDRTDGEITYLYIGGTPTALAHKNGTDPVQYHLAVLLVAVVGLGVGAATLRPTRPAEQSRRDWLVSAPRDRRRLAELSSTVGALAFLAFVVVTVAYFFAEPLRLLSRPSLRYRLTFVLPIIGAIASAIAGVTTTRLCIERRLSSRRRLLHVWVATSLIAMTGFLWYWNLLLPP